MRKFIYKTTAILIASAMILCDNSIVSLANEIVANENVIVSEEESLAESDEEVTVETVEETTEEIAEETAEETTEEATEEAAEETTEETTEEATEETTEEAAEETTEETAEDLAEETTEDESEDSEESEEAIEELSEEKTEESEEDSEDEESDSDDEALAIEELDAADNIAEGECGTIKWVISSKGKLTISGTGDWERMDIEIDRGSITEIAPGAPWSKYEFTSVVVDLTGTTDASYMFANCDKLKSVNFKNFDTSKVTDMTAMFESCHSLTTIDMSNLNMSKVTTMRSMFEDCSKLTQVDMSGLKTTKLNNMSNMFFECYKLNTLNISDLNTSKVTNMFGMFENCESLENLDLSTFNTSNVTEMSNMFKGCKGLESLNISSFNMTNVTKMNYMFADCRKISSLDLSLFKISSSVSGESMLDNCESLTTICTPQICYSNISLPFLNTRVWKDSKGNSYKEFPATSVKLSMSYSIVYVLDGGTNNKSNPDSCKPGQTVTLKNPTRTGYTFDGWYEYRDCLGDKIKTVTGEFNTLYAKWIPNQYTVTFIGNGGNYIPAGEKKAATKKKQSFVYDDSQKPDVTFTRKGYTFTGWNTRKDGKGTAYEPDKEIKNVTAKNNGNVKLYAQWRANKYTIIYSINAVATYSSFDLSGNMNAVEATYNKSIKLAANAYKRAGYSFKGWARTPYATKAEFKNKATVKNLSAYDKEEIILYAVWSINTYNVKFVPNGGKGKAFTLTGFQYGIKQVTLPQNTFTNKDVYEFGAWGTKKDYTGSCFYPGETCEFIATKNNQTFTLYADWLYSLYVYVGEGKEMLNYKIPYNYSFSVNYIAYSLEQKPGYYFAGLATSEANAKKGKIAYAKNVKNVAGKTLYPVYKPAKYTIKFEKNAPSGCTVTGKMSNMSLTYGKSLNLKANAYKCSGYKFKGWSTWSTDMDVREPMFTNKERIEKGFPVNNKEVITLYAIWE